MSKEKIEAMANHKHFEDKAEILMKQLYELIQDVPQKGNKEEDCQYCCLLNRVNDLHSCITGTTVEDFLES